MLHYDVVCKKSLTVYMFHYQIYTHIHMYIFMNPFSMDIINVLL